MAGQYGRSLFTTYSRYDSFSIKAAKRYRIKSKIKTFQLVGYHDQHPVIQWFWQAIEKFDNERRLRLLQVCLI